MHTKNNNSNNATAKQHEPIHLTNELLEDLTNPSISALDLCQIHACTLDQLAAVLESEHFQRATIAIERIANARTRLAEPESRSLATIRLLDQLKDKPTTPAHAETQRKAANHLLSTTSKLQTNQSLGRHTHKEQRHQPPHDRPQVHIAGEVRPREHPRDPAPDRQHKQEPSRIGDQRREHQAPAESHPRMRRGQPQVRPITETRQQRAEVIPPTLQHPVLHRPLAPDDQLEQLRDRTAGQRTQEHRRPPVAIPIVQYKQHPDDRPGPQEPEHPQEPVPIVMLNRPIVAHVEQMQEQVIEYREDDKTRDDHREDAPSASADRLAFKR